MVGARQAISRSGDFKTRAADGNLYIEGYFATFTGEYRMWDKAIERIDRGAFDGTLGDDIRALVNHDTTIVLGRTTAGTLTLRVDDLGLWGSILINQADQDAMNAYERHVIHTALQDYPNVTTYSTGVEPNRRTVVAYAPGQK